MGVEGKQSSPVDIFKDVWTSICTYSGRKYDSSFLYKRDGRDTQQRDDSLANVIWNFPIPKEIFKLKNLFNKWRGG